MTRTSKEIIIAFSLANILFAGSWRIYLYPPTFDYHIKVSPNATDFFGIIVPVILIGLLFWGGARLFKYFYQEEANLLINLIFLTFFLIGLNIIRLQMPFSAMSLPIAIAAQVISFALLAATLTKWRNQVFNAAKAITLVASPFILITFSQAFLGILNHNQAEIDNEPTTAAQLAKIQPNAKKEIKSRVVWIILDEFDYRIPFELKPVEMPEFERLRKSSLSATNATSPARDTLEAIPSLLIGKTVEKSVPHGRGELILNFSGNASAKFSETTNLLTDVKALGGETAVNGFYHSYCRVLGQAVSVCKWDGDKFKHHESLFSAVMSNIYILRDQIAMTIATESGGIKQPFDRNFEENRLEIKEMVEDRAARLKDVYQIAADPKIDLAFIHLPIPHPPSRFDRAANSFNYQVNDYANNLVLADLILGDIRKSLEAAGQWDNSTVIVSTDHQLRIDRWKESDEYFTANDQKLTGGIEDPRIPFFLKLPNQTEAISVDKPFNTLISRRLILALMKGEISTPEDARNWIENAPGN
jgi:hypothetical protein